MLFTRPPYRLVLAAILAFVGACKEGQGPMIRCGAGTNLNDAGTACAALDDTGSEADPPGPGLACGSGTELNAQGTACVAVEEPETITCGPGTELSDDGSTCVVEETVLSCKAGEMLSADGASCIAEALECEVGEVLNESNDDCVPAPLECEAPQVLDADGQTCVLGECPSGTVKRGADCLDTQGLSDATADHRESLPDANDGEQAEAPEAVSLPAFGEAAILAGTLDASSVPHAVDFDDWSFDAEVATAVRVRLLGETDARTRFEVLGPQGYRRLSADGSDVERTLVLPRRGRYRIRVSEAGPSTNPPPAATRGYRIVLEHAALPTAMVLEQGFVVRGRVGTGITRYRPVSDGEGFLRLAVGELENDADPLVLVFDDTTGFIREWEPAIDGLTLPASATDTLWFFVDHIGPPASNDSGYGISVGPGPQTDRGVLRDSGNYFRITLSEGESLVMAYDVPPDRVVRFEVPEDTSLDIFDDMNRRLPSSGSEVKFYNARSRRVVARVKAERDAYSHLDPELHEVTNLGHIGGRERSELTASLPNSAEHMYARAFVDETGVLEVTGNSSTPNRTLRLGAFDARFRELASQRGAPPVLLPSVPRKAGELVIFELFSAWSLDAPPELRVRWDDPRPLETEPNDTPAAAEHLEVDADWHQGELHSIADEDFLAFVAPESDVYLVQAIATLSGPIRLTLSVDGQVVERPRSGMDVSSIVSAAAGQVVTVRITSVESALRAAWVVRAQTVARTGLPQEIEPNDITPAAMTTETGVIGTLSSATDEDWFELTLAESSVLRVSLESVTGPDGQGPPLANTMQLEAYAGSSSTPLDDATEFYAPAGTVRLRVTGWSLLGSNAYVLRAEDTGIKRIERRTDLPVPDDDPEGASVSLEMPDSCPSIASVSVTVRMDHRRAGDLEVSVVSPAGTKRLLHDNTGTYRDLFTTYPLLTTPAESLDALLGENGQGEWTLHVVDSSSGPPGVLEFFRVDLTCE